MKGHGMLRGVPFPSAVGYTEGLCPLQENFRGVIINGNCAIW